MTEFSHQGLHCQYASCHQRDFLPFDCRHCSSHFCLAHRTRDQHECASLKAEEEAARRAPPPPPVSLPPKFKCHYPHCKIKELIPFACRNCAHNHCIKHRFPTQHACESFKGGVGRNTILPAGIVPPRPLDSNNSSKHSTAPIAAAPTRTTASASSAAATPVPPTRTPAPAVIAPVPIAVEIAAPVAPPAVVWETAVAALNLPSSVNAVIAAESVAVAESATARVRTPSPSSPLLHTNTGSSCAAEMAQAASAASDAATSSSSANATSSTAASSSSSTAAAVAKRHNTNVAHLSKLLKQHS